MTLEFQRVINPLFVRLIYQDFAIICYILSIKANIDPLNLNLLYIKIIFDN